MPFHVRTLTGKPVAIRCGLASTVAEVKDEISRIEGIPQDQQRLIFYGKQLEDQVTLDTCHVKPGNTLHLVLCLKGGDLLTRIQR